MTTRALSCACACFLAPPMTKRAHTRDPGARTARSQLPGETDNEDEAELLDDPGEWRPLSRPGSAHVLLPVEESLSNDGVSPYRTLSNGLSPQKDGSLLGESLVSEVPSLLQPASALA